IETALGRRPLDLVIDNVRVVNVYTGRVEPGAIGIKEGRIITTQAAGLETARTFDGGGRYAIPGFIDSHVHLDSSLVTPENLSSLIVPRGTSVMLADPMESANVGGYQGLEALLHMRERLPYHLFVEVSSRVPTAPGLETTGGELGLQEVEQILQWEAAISLGELDPSKVLGLREEYLKKVEAAHRLGKIANGHAAGLSGRDLEAYLCGGLTDDHECVDYEQAFERLSLGMPIFVREGSTERNLVPIIKGVVENNDDTRHMMFCTDDKHPDDILEEGHIDFMVNTAIELGLSPIEAIQMASVNAAVHFRIDHELGSLSPGRWADVVLTDEMTHIRPTHVFFKGQLAAEDGRLAQTIPQASYPDWFYHTVTVSKGREAADFRLEAPGDTARVRVIDLYPDQIINEIGEATLPVRHGNVVADPDQDVLKIAVVERYGRNGNVGVSFVKGFGLKRGALASSVAHDHHNIIVAGANEEDMALCVRAIETNQGGLTIAADGALLGTLPLPLGGLMSEKPVQEVIEKLEEITEISHQLGGVLPAPFMTISFIGLPTVPELGLTDKGLVSVRQHSLLSPFIS
ncbi:MAG: adenine deaminase, partial [Chloroflexota bacterium]